MRGREMIASRSPIFRTARLTSLLGVPDPIMHVVETVHTTIIRLRGRERQGAKIEKGIELIYTHEFTRVGNTELCGGCAAE